MPKENLFIVELEITKYDTVVVYAENEDKALKIIDTEGAIDDIDCSLNFEVEKQIYPMQKIPEGWHGAYPYGNKKEEVETIWERLQEENYQKELQRKRKEAMKPLFNVEDIL